MKFDVKKMRRARQTGTRAIMSAALAGTALASSLATAGDLRLGVVTTDLSPASQSRITQALTSTWIRGWKESTNSNVSVISSNTFPAADVVLGPAEAISQACDEGTLVPTSIRTQMRTGSLLRRASAGCGVAILARQINLGFRRDAFENEAPDEIDALFDPDTFPGKRALVAGPDSIIEWALMSYGVPRQDLYELLSTERGLKLAFRRLDRIRDHTIWCRTNRCTRDALESGEASMSALNHDTSSALRSDPAVGFVSAARITDHIEMAVVDGSQTNEASEFADFAESNAQIEAFAAASKLPGPARSSETLIRDSAWYARTRERLVERFSSWLGDQAVRPR